MYARITTFDAQRDKFDDTLNRLREMLPDILAIPGLKHYYHTGRADDGKCAVVAIYESKEAAQAATPIAQDIFGRFADALASTPLPQEFDVLLHGSNT